MSSPSLSSPIPSFSGNHKGKEILLNLSMKFWNSASNAQGLRVIIVVVHTCRSSETLCSLPKLVKKLVWVPFVLFCFVKFSFPITHLMPYYAETGRSCPLNRVTLWITLIILWTNLGTFVQLSRIVFEKQ